MRVFDPPITTIHCGMISRRNAVNALAAECQFHTDVRYIETLALAISLSRTISLGIPFLLPARRSEIV